MVFMSGNQTPKQTKEMVSNLHEYRGQGTMAKLLDVIQEYLNQGIIK